MLYDCMVEKQIIKILMCALLLKSLKDENKNQIVVELYRYSNFFTNFFIYTGVPLSSASLSLIDWTLCLLFSPPFNMTHFSLAGLIKRRSQKKIITKVAILPLLIIHSPSVESPAAALPLVSPWLPFTTGTSTLTAFKLAFSFSRLLIFLLRSFTSPSKAACSPTSFVLIWVTV